MKILTEYKNLVGKEIVFSHMAMFASQITIATKCGCVLMAKMEREDEWGEDTRVYVLREFNVMNVLERNEWMREELGKLGIFDLEKYKREQRIKRKKEKEKSLIEREERERAEYERLKEKFED